MNERWRDVAACKGKPTEWWYPDANQPHNPTRALNICRSCPARLACLNHAITTPTRERGIWGGTTETQRRHLRLRRKETA